MWLNKCNLWPPGDCRGPPGPLFVVVLQCEWQLVVLYVSLEHRADLFSSLICPPLIRPLSPHFVNLSINLSTYIFLYCIHNPVFFLSMSVFLSVSLPCHVYFPPTFSSSSSPISMCRCSSQQSRLLQNPAAAQHSEETKAAAVARVLCRRLWGAFGW